MKAARNPAAELAAMRRRSLKVCAGDDCFNEFEGIATAKYCSNRCRQRAKYQRKKSEL